MFIVCEGIDKSGKTTVARRLAERIGSRAIYREFPDRTTPSGKVIDAFLHGNASVCYFQQPTGQTFQSEEYQWQRDERMQAIALQALMSVNKIEAARWISDKQLDGKVVVTSRWVPSALVYGAVDGCDAEWLRSIHYGLPEPTLCFLLDVPAGVAIARGAGESETYETGARLTAARERYLDLWQQMRLSNGNWRQIDATRTPDEVFAEVCAWYEARLQRSLDPR